MDEYESKGILTLQDGWAMGPDNFNFRSVMNFPVQGAGSGILRYSVLMAQELGLDVIITLHDAIYVECSTEAIGESIQKLIFAMKEGFKRYFRGLPTEDLANIRLEGKVWGPDLLDAKYTVDGDVSMVASNKHIDKRAMKDYEIFNKYFEKSRRMVQMDLV
jgi:hypothetical protein